MMLHSIKMHVALLGMSLLFAVVVLSAPIPETSSVNSTAETHKLAEISVAVPVESETTASLSVETEEGVFSTSGLVAMNTAATTSNTDPQVLHTSTAVTTSAGVAHLSQNATVIEIAKPTEDQMHHQSPSTSADVAPAVTTVTVAVSSLQATSTPEPQVTSSSTSAANPTTAVVVIQTSSSPSASTTATPTSDTAPVFDPTTVETSTSAERLSTSQPVSVTGTSQSQFPHTTGSNSSAESSTASFSTHSPIITSVSTTSVSTTVSTTNISTNNVSSTSVPTTNVSTSPAVVIPDATLSTKSTTAAPCEVSEKPPSTKVQPCSTRNIAKHCLITIASLAVLATIFMVSTIILCTKLSSRKYKVKNVQPATEMMCISALLPETNYNYSRQRNPVSNGVLVIHGGADSDEEGGDNLTLSSFLPENDRFV